MFAFPAILGYTPDMLLQRIHSLFFTRQFAVFLIFGGSATLTSLVTGWFLYGNGRDVLPYFWAVIVASLAGLLVNFAGNFIFNFHYSGRSMWGQFTTFTIVSLFGTWLTGILATGFLWCLLWLSFDGFDCYGFWVPAKLCAHTCAVAVVTFYSYLAHTYFSFNVGILARLKSLWGYVRNHANNKHDM